MSIGAVEKELDVLLSEDIRYCIEREKNSFDMLMKRNANSIVLFGCGTLGQEILKCLRKDHIEPLAFSDNNSSKWGETIEGVKVMSPKDSALKYGRNAIFAVTIRNHESKHRFAETKKLLMKLNCETIISFQPILWKYSEELLPNYYLDLPHKTLENAQEVLEGFNLFADTYSKNTFLTQLKWRLLNSYDELPVRTEQKQYFPAGIIALSNNETFIDCGAFDGDTVKDFLIQCHYNFHKIVCIEPDPINIQNLDSYISKLPSEFMGKIKIVSAAVGKEEKKINFTCTGTAASIIDGRGNYIANMFPLDRILQDIKPTYIKMDVEGAEEDALIGGSNTIGKHYPVLSVCVYHHYTHIWKIPQLIKKVSEEYKLFLLPHQDEGWELVCYAIPPNEIN